MSHKPLTSSEIASLWTSYLQNTMSKCVLEYFLSFVQDSDIISCIEQIHGLSESNVNEIKNKLVSESIPVPVGFSEHDVNVSAKRMFSDTFCLMYINQMAKVGIIGYGVFQAMVARMDLSQFFSLALKNISDLHNQANELMLDKGLLIRPPMVPTPDSAEFIKSNKYFNGFNPFSEERPLNVIEISHLYENIQNNLLGMMLSIGFSQSARSQTVRDYLFRGSEISNKHIQIFGKLLIDSGIQVPMSWDAQTMESREAPFSDKLMMFHIDLLVASSIGNYAAAAAASMRNDISLTYGRLSGEIAKYAKDGAKIMVENRWLEEPPQAANREEIKNRK